MKHAAEGFAQKRAARPHQGRGSVAGERGRRRGVLEDELLKVLLVQRDAVRAPGVLHALPQRWFLIRPLRMTSSQ